jgi:alkyldihydroxyacetonephosphate synthase
MKWWGWGAEGVAFDPVHRPGVWPFVAEQLKIPTETPLDLPPPASAVVLPAQTRNAPFLAAAAAALGREHIREDAHERLVHAYGKSYRDLLRARRGDGSGAPDVVLYPAGEAEVEAVVRLAAQHDVVLIPFGGGSNIAGCLERPPGEARMVASLDMSRLSRVLEVDAQSCTARIEAGAFGPDLEAALNAQGMTLGHFPDSFLHSTLGGWIATRSAGMQSDKYGKIEDMVVALRMVTPAGVVATRAVPKSAAGLDVNHLCVGGEGTLGVITEAVMRVHPLPAHKRVEGFMFRDFAAGVAALEECVRRECTPSMARLNDPAKTALSLAFKSKSTAVQKLILRGVDAYLRLHGVEPGKGCAMLVKFEGGRAQVARQRRQVAAIYRAHGGVPLGTAPGRSFERAKYDFPHSRDFMMDRGVIVDVSETATVWRNLVPLYKAASQAIVEAIAADGSAAWVGCHVSHTYRTGASLYFTFGAAGRKGDELGQYLRIKKAAEDAFLAHGGTLSHHHAVGAEHLPWLAADVSPTGLLAMQAVKRALDPTDIMTPGRLRPSATPFADWGLPDADRA